MAKHVTISGDLKSFESVMRIIPKEDWHFHPESMKFPIVQCPLCGAGMLGDIAPHGIYSDGKVYNSVVCQEEKCKFHQFIKLEGWTFGAIARGIKK